MTATSESNYHAADPQPENTGTSNGCNATSTHACDACLRKGLVCALPPRRFNRASNIIFWLEEQCKSANDPATKAHRQKELSDYCQKYTATLNVFQRLPADVQKKYEDYYGSEAFKINAQRHKDGLGPIGFAPATNQVVDKTMEEKFLSQMTPEERKRYWGY